MAGRLPIIDTFGEAVGFAGTHYETALRLTWLPVLLSIGWLTVAQRYGGGGGVVGQAFGVLSFGVLLAISAMYYGPLVRLAARDEAPDHGTAPLRLGWSPLRYLVGTLLSLGGAAALTAPVTLGAQGLLAGTSAMRSAEVAVFEEGSLHSVDFVPAFDAAQVSLVEAVPFLALALLAALLWSWGRSWIWTLGLTAALLLAQIAAAPSLAEQLPWGWPERAALFVPSSFLIAAYLALRLTPLPFFWAARRREDDWPVLRSTLGVSAGTDRFRLLAVLGLLAVLNVALGWLLIIVPQTFGLGLAGADALLSGTTALTNGGERAAWVGAAVGGARVLFGYFFTVATTALSVGITAGFGGALVRWQTTERA